MTHYNFHGSLGELLDKLHPSTRITVGSQTGWFFYGTAEQLRQDAGLIQDYYLHQCRLLIRKNERELNETNATRLEYIANAKQKLKRAEFIGKADEIAFLRKNIDTWESAYQRAITMIPRLLTTYRLRIENMKPLMERRVQRVFDNVIDTEPVHFRVIVDGDENGMLETAKEYPEIRNRYILLKEASKRV